MPRSYLEGMPESPSRSGSSDGTADDVGLVAEWLRQYFDLPSCQRNRLIKVGRVETSSEIKKMYSWDNFYLPCIILFLIQLSKYLTGCGNYEKQFYWVFRGRKSSLNSYLFEEIIARRTWELLLLDLLLFFPPLDVEGLFSVGPASDRTGIVGGGGS